LELLIKFIKLRSMKKFLFIYFQFFVVHLFAQLTYVPDDVFEQKLISLGLDDVLDDYVQTASIDTVTVLNLGNSVVSSFEIQDLTGIEDFISLKELYSEYHDFPTLDVSNMPNLEWISIKNNSGFSGINLSNNPNLKHLELWGPSYAITNLDLSANTLLEYVSIRYFFYLSNIQVNNLTNLKVLDLFNNNISSLNISGCTNLEYLKATITDIEHLDVSNNSLLKTLVMDRTISELQSITFNNPELEYIILNDCPNLQDLDLSNTPKLHTLNVTNTAVNNIYFGDISQLKFVYIHNNSQLKELDLSKFKKLIILELNDNSSLNFLDIRNGNQIGIKRFDAHNNPSLNNILVDDPNGFYISNWIIDSNVIFSDN